MKCSGQPSKFRDFFKTPTLHAVLLALLLKQIEVDLPVQISELLWLVEKGILMMAAGALPLLLMNHGYSVCCLRSAGAGWWSPAALVRAMWLPLVAVAMIILMRYTGLAPMEKGYDLIQYLDLRTSEAILLLASAMPCTISLFRQPAGVTGSRRTDTLILSSTVISLFFLVVILCMINRYIYNS